MKRQVVSGLLVLGLVLSVAAPSWSAVKSIPGSGKGFGIGVVTGGDMTGVSAKIWTGAQSAVNLGAAWNPAGGTRYNADLLFHHPMSSYMPGERAGVTLTYGIGGRFLNTSGVTSTALRVPIGLDLAIPGTAMDLYGEVAPTLDLGNNSRINYESSVGLRFFFR